MPPGDEILSVSKEMKTRTVEQIRTRLNNIILGKQKWVFSHKGRYKLARDDLSVDRQFTDNFIFCSFF